MNIVLSESYNYCCDEHINTIKENISQLIEKLSGLVKNLILKIG
jgi:hypothetical protein